MAAAFLNNVANRFIQETDRSRTESAEKTNKWLTQRFEDTKVKLQQAEANLRNFVAKSGNIFADPDHTLDDVKLTQLQGDLAKAQTDRIAKQARYQTALNSKPESVPEIAADDTYQTLRSKLEDLRSQRAILSETLTPKHYKIQRLDAQEQELLAAEKDEITAVMNRLRNEYEDAARHEKLLASAYAAQGGQVNAQAGNAAQYIALKRDVDNLRQMYDTTLQRINQSGAPGSLPIAPIRLVEPCSPPSAPYKPRPTTTIGFGIVAGLALSVGFAFLREKTDRSVKAPGAARILLNIPELGVIPAAGKLPQSTNRGLFAGVKRQAPLSISGQTLSGATVAEDRSVVHAAWEQGVSMLAESFRATLASLVREAGVGTSSKAIMITSPKAGDGKTTITSNLGIALAESGRRVVVVDTDFRRPRIAKVFGISGDTTLEALLEGTSPVADYPLKRIAVETSTLGLWILPSYPSETHISRLIYSPRLPLILDR
ncbi:MAG: GumC family protein, partial [Bryobacteraceae bacterium]